MVLTTCKVLCGVSTCIILLFTTIYVISRHYFVPIPQTRNLRLWLKVLKASSDGARIGRQLVFRNGGRERYKMIATGVPVHRGESVRHTGVTGPKQF
jgi:hypothetical protein